MDLRGYGLPIHPGYAPYPRERYRSEELDVWNPYKPPFPPPEYRDMSPSTSRGPSPSSSSSTDDRSVKAKLAQFSPKPQNPGIDLALRNLSQEVVSSLKMYQSLVLGFDAQTELISDWADGSTLDTVWRNKIKDKFRDKRERERFEGVAGRIANCKKYLKESIRSGLSIKATSDTQYKVEQQIRTAKKALIYCECIIDLSQRAANERRACRDLVRELEELKDLLNQRKNSWIYGEEVRQKMMIDTRVKSGSDRVQRKQDNPEADNGSDTRETDGREQKRESSPSTEELLEASPISTGGKAW